LDRENYIKKAAELKTLILEAPMPLVGIQAANNPGLVCGLWLKKRLSELLLGFQLRK
jgi:hypothetical protein